MSVRLRHTGEVVDPFTTDGANKFLKQCENKDDFNFFSLDLKKAVAIRKKGKKKGKLNAVDRRNLQDIYDAFSTIVGHCDPALFQERVPDREITTWLSHASNVFQEESKGQHWIRTGTLLMHDDVMLSCCCTLFTTNHAAATRTVFADNAFFESISALILARKGAPLGPNFARAIDIAVGNILSCSQENGWSTEKTLKKLEASGLLKDYILCLATKQPNEDACTVKLDILKRWVTCFAFIKKRFKEGTPCGNSLRTVLGGSMVVCPFALPYLQNVLRLSNVSNPTEEIKRPPTCPDKCWCCQKTYQKHELMKCARCKMVSYCSKDCQRADWKYHKARCCSDQRRWFKNNEAANNVLIDFAQRHFVDIMVKMVEESEKAGRLPMRDMVLELDFNPDAHGNIPVLQQSPQFKIFSNFEYIDDAEENGTYENMEKFVAGVLERSGSELVCSCLLADSNCCLPVVPVDPNDKQNMYSEDTLEAFRSALVYGDYGPLTHIFDTEDRLVHIAQEIERVRLQKRRGDN